MVGDWVSSQVGRLVPVADGRVTAMCLNEHAGTINLTILLVSADAVGWLCSTGRVSHEPA
jgi:hypothetical protein